MLKAAGDTHRLEGCEECSNRESLVPGKAFLITFYHSDFINRTSK